MKEFVEEYSEISEKEVFEAVCGEDDLGQPKATVSVKLSDFNIANETEQVFREMLIDNAIVNVFKTPALTMVDLTFYSENDSRLAELSKMLMDFSKQSMSSSDENVLSTIVLTVVPKEDSSIYVSGVHGTFCFMPSVIGGAVDMLRFIFQNDYISAFEVVDGE